MKPVLFDRTKYLSFICLDESQDLTLNQIVKAHVRKIPYQNMNLIEDAAKNNRDFTRDLELENLYQCLIDNKQGGMCYQTAELLYHALVAEGFSVFRVRSIVRAGDTSFDKRHPSHMSLLVKERGKTYLVDPGFGYNGIYGSLEFSLDKTSCKTLENGDQYRVEAINGIHRLSIMIDEKWATLYDLDPYRHASKDDILTDYLALLKNKNAGICHQFIKLGIFHEHGLRIGIHVGLHHASNANLTIFYRDKRRQRSLYLVEEINESSLEKIGLQLTPFTMTLIENKIR